MERYTTKSAVIRGEYRVSPATTENCIEAINKLGRYEDAEEKGLFVHLPCKVGDTAYKISTGMILPSCILMIADKGNGYFAFLEDGTVVSLCDFGKTVFLTPKSAQQALKARESE